MRIDKDNIEEVLIRAVREKAALERMDALDKRMEMKEVAARRRFRRITSYAAACMVLIACGDLSLRVHTRNVGASYEFVDSDRGSSSVLDIMDAGKYKDALVAIESDRQTIKSQLEDPDYDDLVYRYNLQTDLKELDFMEAVCHLRQGRFFKSRKELKSIARGEGPFAPDAQKLLDRLP